MLLDDVKYGRISRAWLVRCIPIKYLCGLMIDEVVTLCYCDFFIFQYLKYLIWKMIDVGYT